MTPRERAEKLLKELYGEEWRVLSDGMQFRAIDHVEAAISEAVAAERAECASIADYLSDGWEIAEAIRARSVPATEAKCERCGDTGSVIISAGDYTDCTCPAAGVSDATDGEG